MAQKQAHQATKSHSTKSQSGKSQSTGGGSKSQSGKAETSSKTQGNSKGRGSNPNSPAHLQKFLAGVDYPVSKQDLVEKAKEEGADEQVMRQLDSLPDRQYGSPVAVSKELGKLN
jgi:hypothetical protein